MWGGDASSSSLLAICSCALGCPGLSGNRTSDGSDLGPIHDKTLMTSPLSDQLSDHTGLGEIVCNFKQGHTQSHIISEDSTIDTNVAYAFKLQLFFFAEFAESLILTRFDLGLRFDPML
ncbi:hypothetical protein B0H17DRAFT_1140235 [Mycena rosella]|uniref:Uncharacterized protein n=1 Tax=Mycena rosella TaxID=1033263 RepID=A0AAD7D304_MYCRO|nr:hypothetical protein B0H17DRAFT_1140235 [Mycena rosella]